MHTCASPVMNEDWTVGPKYISDPDFPRSASRAPRRGRCSVAGVSASSRAFASAGSASAFDERAQRLARHAGLAARQRLQLLVRLGQAVAAHHRLDRLRRALPSSRRDRRRCASASTSSLREALPQRSPAEQRVAERDADVAQHGRIGQVALPARDRQLLGEVPQQRVGEPRLPSAFSKSIGLTLCGIVDEPTSPSRIRCRK